MLLDYTADVLISRSIRDDPPAPYGKLPSLSIIAFFPGNIREGQDCSKMNKARRSGSFISIPF